MHIYSHCAGETETIAYKLAQKASPGMVFCMRGDLGAGKTVFAKGFARGLGSRADITSPTFCIINEYADGRLPFYHFDAYRVNACEMREIGFDDYLFGSGVCLIEWADNILELLPNNAIWVDITHCEDNDNKRRITINGGFVC